MTKQEFMDKKKTTTADFNVLQLMLGMSKTQLLTTLRHLKMINKTFYTTESKQTTLQTLLIQVETAWNFMEHGKAQGESDKTLP